MMGLLQWFVRRVGAVTLLIFGLLFICLASLVFVLNTAVRGLDWDLLGTLGVCGVLIGWLLARSRIRPFFGGVLIVVTGLLASLGRVGQLGDELFGVSIGTGRFLESARVGQFRPQVLQEPAAALFAACTTLVTRVSDWSRAFASGQSTYEPVATAMIWGLLIFLVAAWAAWQLRRQGRALEAILPLALLVAVVAAFSGRSSWTMFLLLAAWLCLVVVVPHVARQRQWDKENIPYAEGLGLDLGMITVPTVMLIVTAAAIVPAVSPQEIARQVRQWNDSTPIASQVISDSLGIEPAPRPSTALEQASSPGLPRSHLLGASPELLKTPALSVRVDDVATDQFSPYWLGTTYDEYTGRGWFSSGFNVQEYRAGERVSKEPPLSQRLFRQQVNLEIPSGIAYAAGTLESVDHDYQVAWRQPDDRFAAQVNSKSYTAESFGTRFDEETLRAAGNNYPAWIRTQYLRLPDDLPPRVLALARDLTATEPTSYDRARAIESYLRTIPYSLDVSKPPGSRDVVDYFLFDLKRGYCDYYATAMAVLARAAGLPARIAVGYAAGKYDRGTHTYRVTEADAHSWTQVYFPSYGWVDFEPTSSRTRIAPGEPYPDNNSIPDFTTKSALSIGHPARWTFASIGFVLLGMFGLLSGLTMMCLFADTVVLRRATAAGMVERLYYRMVRIAVFLDLPVTPCNTPYRLRAILDEFFAGHADSRVFQHWHPISAVLDVIVDQYVQIKYGGAVLSDGEAANVIEKWQSVRLRVVLVLSWAFIQLRTAESVAKLSSRIGGAPFESLGDR